MRRQLVISRVANLLAGLLFILRTGSVAGFWFTDNTFTFQPAQVVASSNKTLESSVQAPINISGASLERPEVVAPSGGNTVEILTKTEPWIRLGQSNEQQQQPGCQCNLDWLENQTSLWLGKWLDRAQAQVLANVSAQMRPAGLSNSTGAASNINRRQQQQPKLAAGNNNGNHWGAAWLRSSGAGQPPLGAPRTGAPSSNKQQQQHQLHHNHHKLAAQGPRGPPGPKGDQGPRGDRGPPGPPAPAAPTPPPPACPLRVLDRDALFDLPAAHGNQSALLVFIEADQTLVLATQAGWRPLQLGAALRDFRRTIAKFQVPSALASSSAGGGSGGARRRLATEDNAIVGGEPAAAATAATRRHLGGGKLLLGGDAEDADDDELAEEDEDEEEEEEEEDEEEDDDDDGAEGDEEDTQREEDNELRGGRSAADLVSATMEAPLIALPAAPAVRPVTLPTAAASTTANAGRRLKLRVAALNEPFSGNVHGIRGADFECKRQATKANIKGSFRALLSSSFQSLGEIVRYNVHKYPVVNLRDETLASSWHDLFRQPVRVANPLSRLYSFDGRHVGSHPGWPNKLVWHGAATKLGQRDLIHNCDGWHSDSLSKFGWATPLHAPKKRSQKRKRFVSAALASANSTEWPHLLEPIDKYPCRMPLIVLCIETVGQASGWTNGRAASTMAESNNIN